ncbi:hypothetical protein HanXRQr2_Chr01g0039091 [Helianthus annuus]|uniref:Uncharacterized protein n=1 Tax=Helianthus annuus TaxID=4232 RepID=A0A9K3P3N9_HELAN|nr:hypothetical protein HanXRQr2_Chr01g0039091 [Helianthus annuus]
MQLIFQFGSFDQSFPLMSFSSLSRLFVHFAVVWDLCIAYTLLQLLKPSTTSYQSSTKLKISPYW